MPPPVGIEKMSEVSIPTKKLKIEKIDENMTNFLKLKAIFLEIKAGNTIRLETKRVPTILMPKTTVTAIKEDIKIL